MPFFMPIRRSFSWLVLVLAFHPLSTPTCKNALTPSCEKPYFLIGSSLWGMTNSVLSEEQLAERVEAQLPRALEDLKHVVSIPSISSQPEHNDDVEAVADWLVEQLKDTGIDDVRKVVEGGKPAILGHYKVDESLPTVLLYAHYDVQPTGDLSLWHSNPFKPVERNGRLFGRGPADDKGCLTAHLAVLRAFEGKPPVNVTVLFEGEEEIGSPTLADILEANKDELRADFYVIADCGNWAPGQPAFTTTLRGVADCIIEVQTLDHGLHSGEYGGPLPDALTTLCRLLATLHDADGNVAVKGLVGTDECEIDYTEEQLRNESQVLDGVKLLGSGPLGSRLWLKPSICVIGMDTTPISESANLLLPTARARISVRVAPGDSSENVLARVKAHLEEHNEWGAKLNVYSNEGSEPSVLPAAGPMYDLALQAWEDAFGKRPVPMGTGGSIGMIADFMNAFPEAFVLGCGTSDPDSRMHGIDESLTIEDWKNTAHALALLINRMADK